MQRPIFLSGRIMADDGVVPEESATIELFCNGTTRPFGHTDSKGRFSITLGQTPPMMSADASVGSPNDMMGMRSGSPMGGFGPNSGGISERDLMGCEIRASLPGYMSDSVPLTGRRFLDNPDIGTIIMRRLGKVDGLLVSMTNANAPKDAKKAYEKGVDRFKKQKLEEAESSLRKAVEIYPSYAAAWFQLGLTYEVMKKPSEAMESYAKSISADSKYIQPHVRLMNMHMGAQQWDKALVESKEVLRLNPYNIPEAWYYNSLANLQLQNLDEAEKSARETIKIDRDKKYLKAHHVLGVVLANKNDYKGAVASIRSYLELNPDGRDSEFVKKQLAEIEERVKQDQ